MGKSVVGNGVLIVGDLHISDVYSGRHKSYLTNCFYVLGEIRDKVLADKPSALVILGDIVGLTESNIKRREVLGMFCKFFKEISEVCQVFCVRGNHDFSDYPEFQFLSELNVFETSASCGGYFDYYGTSSQTEPEVRFHLVDFGCERKELAIKGGCTTDIVLAHNNFTIQGLTNWYNEHDGIDLSMLNNFEGVYMVISGHIHNPSPEIYATDMNCGGTCSLFYPGCPTRPSFERNLYPSVWFVSFRYDEETQETNYSADEFKLKPIEEVFHLEENFVEDKTEDEIANIERTEALKDVLDDIIKCRMTSGDIIQQVLMIPYASEEAKKMASDYLRLAIDNKA